MLRYSAGDESWKGWVEQMGSGLITLNLASDSMDDLTWVLACLKKNDWNANVPIEFESPEYVDVNSADWYHRDKDNNIGFGKPEPSEGNDSSVDWEYLDGGGVFWEAYGFTPNYCCLSVDGDEVAADQMCSLLLALALLANVDLNALPDVPAPPDVKW